MKYLKAPGTIMTADMAWHKNNGTSGEDWVMEGKMTTSTQMTKPCIDMVKIGDEWFSDGTYKEFFHGTMNGYKFSCYTCHCEDFVTVGDNYAGSTGLHIHLLCFHGHQTQEYMQQNRNTKGVTLAEIDAKCVPQNTEEDKEDAPKPKTFKAVRENKSKDNGTFYFDEKYYSDLKDGTQANSAVDTKGNTWEATTTWTKVYAPEGSSTKEIKGYSFKKCSSNNGSSFFSIEEYGSTEDDLCFNIENLKKLSTGAYDLIKAQHDYEIHTQFKDIKTTFYK